jgi:hypothetical protein
MKGADRQVAVEEEGRPPHRKRIEVVLSVTLSAKKRRCLAGLTIARRRFKKEGLLTKHQERGRHMALPDIILKEKRPVCEAERQ